MSRHSSCHDSLSKMCDNEMICPLALPFQLSAEEVVWGGGGGGGVRLTLMNKLFISQPCHTLTDSGSGR